MEALTKRGKARAVRVCWCGKEFSPRGPQLHCGDQCRITYRRKENEEWRRTHPDRVEAWRVRWRPKGKLLARKRRAENPEKTRKVRRLSMRKWAEKNPLLAKARSKARYRWYRFENLPTLREMQARARLRKKERLDIEQLIKLQNIQIPTKPKKKAQAK